MNVYMNIFILEGVVYTHDHISMYLGCVEEKGLCPGEKNSVHSFQKKYMKISKVLHIFKGTLKLRELQ